MRQARGTYAPRPCQVHMHVRVFHNQNSHHCLRYAFLPQLMALLPLPSRSRSHCRFLIVFACVVLDLNFKHLLAAQTIHSNLISNACFMGFLCFSTVLATRNCFGIFVATSPARTILFLCPGLILKHFVPL